jgi:N-acetylneuraminic acid mutarotase
MLRRDAPLTRLAVRRWPITGARLPARGTGLVLALALLISGTPGARWIWPSRAESRAADTTALFAWRTLAPETLGRFEAQGAVADGKLYVFGGFFTTDMHTTKRADVYDPATGRWTRLADMPEALSHSPVVVDGQTIYLVGGFVGNHPGPSTAHVWKYHIPSNTWSAAPDLPEPRGASAAVRLGRTLHLISGSNRVEDSLDYEDAADHFTLDLDGGVSWGRAAPLPNPRNHLGAAVLGGKIYAIGGQHGRFEASANQQQVDVYNPATDSWSQAAPLPEPRGHISSSTFTLSNQIVVVGGTVNGGSNGNPTGAVTAYDPASNIWIDLPTLPAARKSPVAGAIGAEIVVATGNSGGSQPTPTTWAGQLANTWTEGARLPVALGDVAGGIIGDQLYLVGAGNSATLAYNLSAGQWRSADALATRPIVGRDHAAEVIGGELYLFGGLVEGGPGALRSVQIYNPGANRWRLGAQMPFAAGASATALINGQVYLAGGVGGDSGSTAQTARYDPVADRWTLLAAMPQARNHAAAASDGRKLFVFGGRAGSAEANGFDTVQVYDPASDSWASSLDAGSTLAPLPQARSGMGRAVYHKGEFYMLGGETLDGAGASAERVYNRVDIYNPGRNTWRQGPALPTARHGVFPLLQAGRIYVAGGGREAGTSSTAAFEIYHTPASAPLSVARYLPLASVR